MFCSKCGKQLPDNTRFCPDCGNSTTPPVSESGGKKVDLTLAVLVGVTCLILLSIGFGIYHSNKVAEVKENAKNEVYKEMVENIDEAFEKACEVYRDLQEKGEVDTAAFSDDFYE